LILGLLVIILGGAGYISARYRAILARRAALKPMVSPAVEALVAREAGSEAAQSRGLPVEAPEQASASIAPVVIAPEPKEIIEEQPAAVSASLSQGEVSGAVVTPVEIDQQLVALPTEEAVSTPPAALGTHFLASLAAAEAPAARAGDLETPVAVASTETASEAALPRRRDDVFASLKAKRTPSQLAAAELFKVKRARVRRPAASDSDVSSTGNAG